MLSWFSSSLLVFSLVVLGINGANDVLESDSSREPLNIIMIMFDDLGRSDLGAFGAEWETPNLDKFMSNSVVLSRHYIGYVCSASRSQFLTGRYAFHNGYGTLNVFDVNRLGALPLTTPTIVEYLKEFGSYQTYGVGKWQLGSSAYDHMAYKRGFDHFWGFNGGMEDYTTKVMSATDGNDYLDFWENDKSIESWVGEYSTDQYITKMIEILDERKDKPEPFFIYTGLQAIHAPFSEDTQYYDECKQVYGDDIDLEGNEFRLGVCEGVVGADYQIGRFMDYFENNEELKAVWDKTVIIVTSDNGGDLGAGSCNYPLRGGKDTFFEGSQRVVAAVGGGALPNEQRGIILDGLMSNVDWFPTLLAFANIIPKTAKRYQFKVESEAKLESISKGFKAEADMDSASLQALNLDGYNMFSYIMDPSSRDQLVRDHILFHLIPKLEKTELIRNDISHYSFEDLAELALIFYDEDGTLWKYFDASTSTNPIGNPELNSAWCALNLGDDAESSKYSYAFSDRALTNIGLYDITNDVSESYNYLDAANDDENLKVIPKSLYTEITHKVDYYLNRNEEGNKNSATLYGNFDCFTQTTELPELQAVVLQAIKKFGAWSPYVDINGWKDLIRTQCGIMDHHPIFRLLTGDMVLPDTIETSDTDKQADSLNKNTPTDEDTVANMHRKWNEAMEDNNVVENEWKGQMVNIRENNVVGVKGSHRNRSNSLVNIWVILLSIIGVVAVGGLYLLYKFGSDNKNVERNEYSPLTAHA